MTGEMHKSEVTRDAFPTHFAIADALDGEVRPFDQYQGPYILIRGARLWVIFEEGMFATIYNEANEKQSEPFLVMSSDVADFAANAARSVLK